MTSVDKIYGLDSIVDRVFVDRRRAYERHKRQYRARSFLSKIGLAKPISPPEYVENEEKISTEYDKINEAMRIKSRADSIRR